MIGRPIGATDERGKAMLTIKGEYNVLHMTTGQSLDVMLPNGTTINIEIRGDGIGVIGCGPNGVCHVLYTSEQQTDGSWLQDWPTPHPDEASQVGHTVEPDWLAAPARSDV